VGKLRSRELSEFELTEEPHLLIMKFQFSLKKNEKQEDAANKKK